MNSCICCVKAAYDGHLLKYSLSALHFFLEINAVCPLQKGDIQWGKPEAASLYDDEILQQKGDVNSIPAIVEWISFPLSHDE